MSGGFLDKGGAGTLTLTAANTNTGFHVNAGRLIVQHDEALGTDNRLGGTNAVLELGNGITVSDNLVVENAGNNKTLNVSSGNTGTFAGNIAVNETTARNFDLTAAVDSTLIVSGVISGGGSVIRERRDRCPERSEHFSGNFTLGDGGVTTFDGASGNKHGFVVVNDSGALGSGTIVSRGSQLQAGVGGINISQDINVNDGGLRLGGSESFELSGVLAAVNNNRTFGHYGLEGVNITISGEIDLDQSGTARNMDFAGSNGKNNGDFLITGNITGGGNVTISNSLDNGRVILSGDNNAHTGNYSVANGTNNELRIAASNIIADTAVITQQGRPHFFR